MAFYFIFFFFNDTATTEIYTLSLHDALPISRAPSGVAARRLRRSVCAPNRAWRSEEHTSELQSHVNLVCRLLLEKKKNRYTAIVRNSYMHDTYTLRITVSLLQSSTCIS